MRNEGHLSTTQLPTISARVMNNYSKSVLKGNLVKFPDAVFGEITKPMIDSARANGFMAIKKMYDTSVRQYYKGMPVAASPDFEKMVEDESTAEAVNWIVDNTYQGTRSVVGGALRNVMALLWCHRQPRPLHHAPGGGDPLPGRGHAARHERRQRGPGQHHQSGARQPWGFLAQLGFGGGEGMQFNPMNAFFLTADGLGSVIPGTGPVFAPMWGAISNAAPPLAQFLATLPGFQQEIDWSTGQASPMFPGSPTCSRGVPWPPSGRATR